MDCNSIRELGLTLRVDLVGFAAVPALEVCAPAENRPSTLALDMQTLIVLGRRVLYGVTWSRHLRNKQLAYGHSLRVLDGAAGRLAERIESAGHVALPVGAAAFDFEKRPPEDAAPAGQGSRLLRLAAVEAGLGTWGLNTMVLTPEFGPRVHFAGVLTDLALAPGRPIDGELCPGLQSCGRCAVVCPEDAIPRRAPAGAPLTAYRALDCRACVRSSQPFGARVFEDFAATTAASDSPEALWRNLHNRTSSDLWMEMTMFKEGSVSGCSACLDVCPVGRDRVHFDESPHRQCDLPGPVCFREEAGTVEAVYQGPAERRKITWESWKSRTS